MGAFLIILLIAFLPSMYHGLTEVSKALGDALQPTGSSTTYKFFSQSSAEANKLGADAGFTDVSGKFAYLIWMACQQLVYLINASFDFIVGFMAKLFAPVAGFLVVVAHFPAFRGKCISAILFFCQVAMWPIGWGICEAIINIIFPVNSSTISTMEGMATYGLIRTIWLLIFTWYVPKFFAAIFGAGAVSGMTSAVGAAAGTGASIAATAGRAKAAGSAGITAAAKAADNMSKGKVGKAVEAGRKLRESVTSPFMHSYRSNQIRKGKVITTPPPKPRPII